MKARFSISLPVPGAYALVTVLALSFCLSQAAEPPKGKPIEFAGESSPASTNLNNLATKQNSFDPLKRALAGLPEEGPKFGSDTGSALSPVPPPSLRQTPQESKKMKEALERRKNWGFMSPDELLTNPEDESLARLRGDKGKEGDQNQDRLDLTPAERFILNIGKEEDLFNSRNSSKGKGKSTTDGSQVEIPESLKSEEQRARELLQISGGETTPSKRTQGFGIVGFGTTAPVAKQNDFFGLNQTQTTTTQPDQTPAQKARVEEFRQMVGLPPTPTSPLQDLIKTATTPSFDPLKPFVPPTSTTTLGNVMPSLQPKAPDVQFGTLSGLPGLADFGAKQGWQPGAINPQAPVLNNTSAKPTPLPTFTAPKRTF